MTSETLSAESGSMDFIAAGTTTDRGEDLAVKGAVSNVILIVISFAQRCSSKRTSLRSSRWYQTRQPTKGGIK